MKQDKEKQNKKQASKKGIRSDSELYGSATVGSKGQIVIPVEARNKLDIKTGDQILVFGNEENKVIALIKASQLSDIVGELVDI